MSPDMKRPDRAEELTHERARMLAAESVDAQLQPNDAAWLGDHLGSCLACTAVDEEYRAIHTELHGLSKPEPPRDLWARTAAALDVVDSAAARKSPGRGTANRLAGRPLLSTAFAVGVVVVVAAVSIAQQGPLGTPRSTSTHNSLVAIGTAASSRPSTAPQGPLAVVDGTKYWIASSAGVYEIKGSSAQCLATDGSCSVASGAGQTLGSIASDSIVSAAIAPDATRAAVWTKDKIAIVPLAAMPLTVSLDKLTPRPTVAATAAPIGTPASTPVSGETSAPETSPAPASTATTLVGPIAILSGYEIVGRDPEFSADGTLLAFAARPVDHSTGPDVFVWRVGQDRAEPVTFRHADLLAGWYGRQILISEISATASDGTGAAGYSSYIYDPSTEAAREIDRPMLLPAVDPTGEYLIYWSGTVEFDPASGLWQPGTGDLYFDSWADLTLTPVSLGTVASPTDSPSPSPSATPASDATTTPAPTETPTPTSLDGQTPAPDAAAAGSTETPAAQDSAQAPVPQILPVAAAPNQVQGWIIRWDASGRHVAAWVAESGTSRIGRLGLFSINRTTRQVDTNEPLLAANKVMSSIAFDDGHLVYTSAVDGKTYIQTIPAVPPSTVATPAPTLPGELPSDGTASDSPPPQNTDQPGN